MGDSETFRSLETLQNQAPKPSRTSRALTFEYKEHSKQKHSSHPSRSLSYWNQAQKPT